MVLADTLGATVALICWAVAVQSAMAACLMLRFRQESGAVVIWNQIDEHVHHRAGMQVLGKWEILLKTHRPVASSGTILTCENPRVTRLGIEPGSPWWEASTQESVAMSAKQETVDNIQSETYETSNSYNRPCQFIDRRPGVGMQGQEKREIPKITCRPRWRPARFPHAKIWEQPRQESNQFVLAGVVGNVFLASGGQTVQTSPLPMSISTHQGKIEDDSIDGRPRIRDHAASFWKCRTTSPGSLHGTPLKSPRPIHFGFSQVGNVTDDASDRQVFSGISRFPHPFIPALLHPHLTLKDLNVKSRPNLFTHSLH
ncbi:hypothetical protein PR048_012450 [Dryococelus australis]|uniref:Uncharacterized protein n=1 Tax=Dryococelus australis TaxID=614101 RepID=A0ABQ9HPL1_9NEOP|nr:hypothetical protein PR048_012450 [Dryococelus australis]